MQNANSINLPLFLSEYMLDVVALEDWTSCLAAWHGAEIKKHWILGSEIYIFSLIMSIAHCWSPKHICYYNWPNYLLQLIYLFACCWVFFLLIMKLCWSWCLEMNLLFKMVWWITIFYKHIGALIDCDPIKGHTPLVILYLEFTIELSDWSPKSHGIVFLP